MSELKPRRVENYKKSKNDNFKNSLGLSLVLHGIILSLFLIKFIFFSKPVFDLSQAISVNIGNLPESNKLPEKAIPSSEIHQEKKIDDNKLPPKETKTVPEVKAETPKKIITENKETQIDKHKQTKEPEKNIVKQDSINLNKSKQKEALNKLKKMSALDKIKQEIKSESMEKLKIDEKKPTKGDYKPRIIAAGTAISGLDKLEANSYLQQVDSSIKQFWSLPQWLMNKPLKAQVLVKFNTLGEVLSSKVVSSSGNNSYDQYCLQAIEKAAPFPSVPEKLSEKFSIDGIIIGFPE